MSKLTALVFRSVIVASLFGSAVACTAEIQVPEGLGSKVSDALGTKKGHDGGSSSDASVDEPDAGDGDASIVIQVDGGSWGSDGGIDETGDASVWGDDDDSSSDGGVSSGSDASAW
jgi:hypothetical protein